MTLALYGKSRKRQGSLMLLALFAVLAATLGGVTLYGRNASAATATIGASSATCSNYLFSNDSSNCPSNALSRLTADDGNEVWLEEDEDSPGTGADALTVTFSLAGYSGTLNSAKIRVWSTQFDDAAQLRAGTSGDSDKYGELAAGNSVDYTVTADVVLGGNFTVYLRSECTSSSNNDNCGIKVDKVELVIDYTAPAPAPTSGDGVIPTFLSGSSNSGKTCADVAPGTTEYKLENGTLTNGAHVSGPLTVTISNLNGDTFNWSSNIGLDAVVVKGGSGGSALYAYSPEDTADTGLGVPDAANNGISHLSFCYDVEGTRTFHIGKVVYPDDGQANNHAGGTFSGTITPGGTHTTWSATVAPNTDYSPTQDRTVSTAAQTVAETSSLPTGWSFVAVYYKAGNHTCNAPWANGFTLASGGVVPAGTGEVTVCVKNYYPDVPPTRELKVCKSVEADSAIDGQFTLSVSGQADYQPTVTKGNTACTTYSVPEGTQVTVDETTTPAGWSDAAGYPKYTLANGSSAAGAASSLGANGVTVTVNNNSCGTSPGGSSSTDCTVTIINKSTGVANPKVVKTVTGNTVGTNGQVTYSIVVSNTGNVAATGVSLDDTTGGATVTDIAEASATAYTCETTNTFPCAIGTLNAGASVTFTVTVTAIDQCTTITNSASVTSTGGGNSNTTDDTSAADSVSRGCQDGTPTIEKGDATYANGVLNWVVTVTNTANFSKHVLVYDADTSLVAGTETCTNVLAESPADYYDCEVAGNSSASFTLSSAVPTHTNVCQPQEVTNTAYIAASTTSGATGNLGSNSGTYTIPAAPNESCVTVSKTKTQTSTPPTWEISITNSAATSIDVFVKDANATYQGATGGSCTASTGASMTDGIACSANANSTLVITVQKANPAATCDGTDVSNSAQVWLGTSATGEPDFTRDGGTFEDLGADKSLCTGTIIVHKAEVGEPLESDNNTWDFALSQGPTSKSNQSITDEGTTSFEGLTPGTYAVSELGGHGSACSITSGYPFSTKSGSSEQSQSYGSDVSGIAVVGGETVHVYFTNESCPGIVRIHKVYPAGVAGDAATFTGYLDFGGKPSNISWGPVAVNSSTEVTNVPGGTDFSVVEDSKPGYEWIGVGESAQSACSDEPQERLLQAIVALLPWNTGPYSVTAGQSLDLYVCNRPVGDVTLVKVDSVSGVQTWDFQSTIAGLNSSIQDSGQVSANSQTAGTYTVKEVQGLTQSQGCIGAGAAGYQTSYTVSVGGITTVNSTVIGSADVTFPIEAGKATVVTFYNDSCTVRGEPLLIVQKFSDPAGDRTGTQGITGFTFHVKKDGNPIQGSPFTMTNVNAPNGFMFWQLEPGNYTVEEVTPNTNYAFTGSKTDLGDNGSFEASVSGQPAAVTLDYGDNARINFYNQPRTSIQVRKTQNGGAVNFNWTFTLTGCGIAPQQLIINGSGTGVFSNLPPAVNCSYTVTEGGIPASWTVSPAGGQVTNLRPLAAGEQVTATFVNTFNVPPCTVGCTPVIIETPTPTPVVPTATPTRPTDPTATNTPVPPTATQTKPPVDDVRGERTPGALSTPIAPNTGSGFGTGAGSFNGLLALVGLAILGSGLAVMAVGRKRS